MRKSLQKTAILIVRLGAMGDIVLSSPVAFAIRKHNPNARICWLVQTEFRSMLDNNPAIDELICWDKTRWQTLLKERKFFALLKSIRDLRRKLKAMNFDLALDLHGLLKSGFLAWLSGAKTRVGLGSREGSNLFMTRTISRNLGDQTQIGSEYRYLLNQLGYPDQHWHMYVSLPEHAQASAKKLLQEKIGDEHFAVICPFSSRPQNQWFQDYWQHLVLRIRGRYQLKTIILGGHDDTAKAEQIAQHCGAINLAGLTSFQESGAIIQNASLVIGVDTGLTHMGHALKSPTISLFGSTCPYSHTGQETSTVIYLDRFCSPCARKPTCRGKFECMKEITPDMVLSEIKPLMKNFYEISAREVF